MDWAAAGVRGGGGADGEEDPAVVVPRQVMMMAATTDQHLNNVHLFVPHTVKQPARTDRVFSVLVK